MATLLDPIEFNTPKRASTIGMWLFLMSLAMLFTASMLAYYLIRFTGPRSPDLGVISFSPLLWVSSLLILLSSFTIHRALSAVRLERLPALRFWLLATLALSLLFCIVQVPALGMLLAQHAAASQQTGGIQLYGLIFCLILLHAAHVVGGLVYLLRVTLLAYAGRYDHEHYMGVKHAVLYWHFLDAVWLIMFLSMYFLG